MGAPAHNLVDKYAQWAKKSHDFGATIVVPNGALSYTSINMLRGSHAKWVDHYIGGNKKNLDTQAIRVGRDFAEAMETSEDMRDKYPSLPVRERAVTACIPLSIEGESVCLLIKTDAMTDDMSEVIDHKTQSLFTKDVWTEKRVYESLQFRLYALAIYTLTGSIPLIRCVVVPHDNGVISDQCHEFSARYPMHVMEWTRKILTEAAIQANYLLKRELDAI